MNDKLLFRRAKSASGLAYAPYSGFRVGAAALTASGEIFEGANVENSSYGATVCAERVAVSNAVLHGHKDGIVAIAIAAFSDGRDHKPSGFVVAHPCGICRQFIFEFGADIRIIVGKDEDHLDVRSISELLPQGFRL
ncbi:MAG: cytidine deaminase [Clostridiales Family XIII bacterium]|jgi:cytidine deaminase|nr:cytidine deaminase [Clostridiales Family XIII bacterium]